MTGESTPGYSVLAQANFARIKALNPEVKLIFIMRYATAPCLAPRVEGAGLSSPK